MFYTLLAAVLDVAVATTLLGILVFGVTRLWRNPAARHALWLLVLIKLICPPFIPLPLGHAIVDRVGGTIPADWRLFPVERRSLGGIEEAVSAKPIVRGGELIDEISENKLIGVVGVNPAVRSEWLYGAIVCALWLACSAFWFTIAGIRILQFHRAVQQAVKAPEAIERLAIQVAGRLGYRGALEIRISNGRFPPLLWAVNRPMIVLPEFACTHLGTSDLTGILAHEISHLLRRDHWVRWLELAVFGLYWWHPVAWWARKELREAEEEACDARVIASWEGSAAWYVQALLAVSDLAANPNNRVPRLASGFGSNGSLKRRVYAMINRNRQWQMGRGRLGFVLLIAAVVLPLSLRADADDVTAVGTDLDIADVRDGVRKLEQRIANLSVTCETESVNHFRDQSGKPPKKGLIEDDAKDLVNMVVSTWVVDSSGRMWQKHSGKSTAIRDDGTRIQHKTETEAVFDGQFGHAAIHRDDNGVSVKDFDSPRTYYTLSPLDFTVRHLGTPVSQILLQEDAKIAGSEKWEGRTVIAAEARVAKQPAGTIEYKTRLLIDPSLGFAVVRRQSLARYAETRPWHLHLDVVSRGMKEVSPGAWLPSEVEIKNFVVPNIEPKNLDFLVSHDKLRLRDWTLNEMIPDSKFEFSPKVQ